MIRLEGIQKTFSGNDLEVEVLKNINIHVKNGEFLGILGRSGSGKSTLLNILGLIDDFTAGSYYLNGLNIENLSSSKKASIRRDSIGYVFQSFNLISDLNVIENISMPLGYAGVSKKNRHKKAMELLEMVNLSGKSKMYPSKLSGGEKQRVAIARALSNNPDIILADEPTGALDLNSALNIMDILITLNKLGRTIIMVTHDRGLTKYMSRVVEMKEGVI